MTRIVGDWNCSFAGVTDYGKIELPRNEYLGGILRQRIGHINNLPHSVSQVYYCPNKLPAPVDPTSIENIVEMLVQLLKTAPGGLTPSAAASIVQAQVNPLLNPLASTPPAPSAPAGQTLKITGGTLQVSL